MMIADRIVSRLAYWTKPIDPSRLWKRYTIALALIFALLTVSHFVATEELASAHKDASNINISGRQRMLSQRIAMAASKYVQTGDPAWRETLAESVEVFEASHTDLRRAAMADRQLAGYYRDGDPSLNTLVSDFTGHAHAVIGRGDTASEELSALSSLAQDPLLSKLDAAVSGFERISRRRAEQLRIVQELSLLGAIITLIAEGVFIFWPAHKTVKKHIAALRAENESTRKALNRLSNFASIASGLFWETDLNGHMVYAEGDFLNRMQGGRDSLLGCMYSDLIKFDDENQVRVDLAVGSLARYDKIVGQFVDADGRIFMLEVSGRPRVDEQGNLLGYCGTADDITRHHAEKEQILELAFTDPLTGLGNKRTLKSNLTTLLPNLTEESPAYLLAIDLDGFKSINDTYGHGAGDQVLQMVGRRIEKRLGERDWAVRIGGDEYVVCCVDPALSGEICRFAAQLCQDIAWPYTLQSGVSVRVSASIGVACAPADGADLETILETADAALYEAKRNGRNTVRFAADLEEQVSMVS